MIGDGYWSTGIMVRWYPDNERDRNWSVKLEFLDDGFCEMGSTEGELRCRYVEPSLSTAIDTLKADAERLGIIFKSPTVYMYQDSDAEYPEDWRAIVDAEAERLGWRPCYRERATRLHGP